MKRRTLTSLWAKISHEKPHGSFDVMLIFLIGAFLIFGVWMISSVSWYPSIRITTRQVSADLIDEAHTLFFLSRSLIQTTIAWCAFLFVMFLPKDLLKKYTPPYFILCVIGLLSVLFIGTKLNGATWWISIPWVPFTIQPTEFIKLGFIMFLASYFAQKKGQIHHFNVIDIISMSILGWLLILAIGLSMFLSLWIWLCGILLYFIVFVAIRLYYEKMGIPTGILGLFWVVWLLLMLIGFQPDFWTLFILAPIWVVMFFLAWGNIRYIGLLMWVGFILCLSVYFIGGIGKDDPDNYNPLNYIHERVDKFISPSKESIEDGSLHHQNKQALIAIGSWGIAGLWFGRSVQKYGYLPEPYGDFIFSIIAEELGFIWVLVVISLYLLFAYKWLVIASRSDDLFCKYAAAGITTWVLVQATINMWVNLNSFPNTWVTLPFISYGGSSILSLMLASWILLSISRYTSDRPTGSKRFMDHSHIRRSIVRT